MRMSGARVSAAVLALVVVTLAGCVRQDTDMSGGQDATVSESQDATVSGSQDADVSGSVPSERIESYEAMAVTALGQVEDLWGADSVARPVEVVLPASGAEFEALTGVSGAGVPAATVGSLQDARVVVHPDSWGLLTPEGRQAVLTHEVTHLAQQGDGPVPAWLGEGLAEYTAHRDSGLPPATISGTALDGVRSGVLPSTWPDPTSPSTDATGSTGTGTAWGGYALSWLACLYIAETWSESALLELYETVAAGTDLSEAVPEVLNVSEAELHTGWTQWLAELA